MLNNFAETTLSAPATILLAFTLLYGPIILVSVLGIRLIRRFLKRRQFKHKTVVVEFKPPLGLSPAELGYLYDTKLDKREMVATLIDLSNRGFISLHQSKGYLSGKRLKSPENLKPHEAYLVKVIGKKASLNFDFFIAHRILFELNLQNSLVSAGYLNAPSVKQYVRRIIYLNYVAAIIFPSSLFAYSDLSKEGYSLGNVLLILVVLLAISVFYSLILFPVYSIFSAITLKLYSKIAGKSWLKTNKLRKHWREIEGYRQFVKMVEIDNIQFETNELKQKSRNNTLPYAVALGFNIRWKSQFEESKLP